MLHKKLSSFWPLINNKQLKQLNLQLNPLKQSYEPNKELNESSLNLAKISQLASSCFMQHPSELKEP